MRTGAARLDTRHRQQAAAPKQTKETDGWTDGCCGGNARHTIDRHMQGTRNARHMQGTRKAHARGSAWDAFSRSHAVAPYLSISSRAIRAAARTFGRPQRCWRAACCRRRQRGFLCRQTPLPHHAWVALAQLPSARCCARRQAQSDVGPTGAGRRRRPPRLC
jgi:hypothetical protein